jgi:hypothetical protein
MIDSLPTSVMKEVLQSICRELDLSDVSEIVGSIEKLKYVVKSVPRMERFITQVSSFVLTKEEERKASGSASAQPQSASKLEEVVNILKKWWANLRKIELFATFHDGILQELSRREKVLSDDIADANDRSLYWAPTDQSRWRAIHPSRVQAVLRDVVDFQLDIMKREKTVRLTLFMIIVHVYWQISQISYKSIIPLIYFYIFIFLVYASISGPSSGRVHSR